MKYEIKSELLESLLTLSSVIEARDAYTGGHTWRVSQYASLMAKKSGLPADEVFIMSLGGLVHDIGKISVPDAILNKKGPLDDNEYKIMKYHPQTGRTIIEKHPLAPLVFMSVTEHHERPDGNGYPAALSDLSVFGKIISICDAFDAMTSTRSYRAGMPMEKAFAILKEGSGSQFEPFLVSNLISLGESNLLSHVLGHAGEDKLMLDCPTCGPIIAPPDDLPDGGQIECPACTGAFHAHKSRNSFELDFTGSISGIYTPKADRDCIIHFTRQALKNKFCTGSCHM
ncbi:MAG: phosphohydrolase [Spirochaetae bacterium HGW-Spirochaetae-5]|nr:MAG: phosphohydrolase [Spirochaetae bacterium HGW-Spirochaetae-5]